ncbi:MAG: TonB-dependent receptor [Bryobacteraceae bacterium]
MAARQIGLVACCLFFVVSSPLAGQEKDETTGRLKALEERIRALEAEVHALKQAQVAATPAVPAASSPTAPAVAQAPTSAPAGTAGQLPVYGGASAGTKVFNPDIGVIGNFVGVAGRNDINPLPALSLQESEVSLQAVVDPYARADFFLAIGEEGIEVEEGYVTFPTVPGGFLVRAGKMRAAFGRVNTFHNHTLPWIDRPLATFNLLGGSLAEPDIGIKDAGISVSRILPPLRGIFMEATGEVFRGDSGSLFKSSRRSDVSLVSHLKSYRDFSESTSLELGGSYGRGHNDVGSDFITQLYGLDATLRWRPLRRAIYHSFAVRTELFWSRRDQLPSTQRAFGYFGSMEYQLARRWFAGGRYDWAERARDATQHDTSGSLILTFWPSEFNQIRAQFRRTRYAEHTSNEMLFQFLFTVGAHGAHPF